MSPETSEPAWMNRKMLSMSSSTSRCSLSRKYSAMVSAVCPTRKRLPGSSFIWPKTITMLGSTPGRLHLAIQLFALAAALADAAEQADTVVMSDHVVDHLGQQNGLTDAGTPEQPGLAAALQRHEHIDGLDAGLEDLALGGALRQRRRRAVYRAQFDIGEVRGAIDRLAEDVEHPGAYGLADRDLERAAGILDPGTPRQSLRGSHGDSADAMRIQLCPDLDQDLRLGRPRAAGY